MTRSKLSVTARVAIVAVGLVVNLAIGRAFVHWSGANELPNPNAPITGAAQHQTGTGPQRDDLAAPRT